MSVLVNAFKGTSSLCTALLARYFVSPSYFAASTGGATLAVVRQYVEQQRASPTP
ncbi:MAG: transposase [Bradyrhizobium sp.]|nr:transposase [Bradyrhizobium sp.]